MIQNHANLSVTTPRQFVFCILVGVALLASGHIVTADQPPAGGTHGIPPNETAKLWSLDNDQYITDSQYRNQTGENRTTMEALLNGTDYVWTTPPTLPARWNRRDWAAYSRNFSTNRNQSIHPEDAHLRQSSQGWIQDAHATLYRIQPSTRLYQTPNQTVRYIAPDGQVRGLVDYRVQLPANDTDETDGQKTFWTLRHHEITAVCVVQGPSSPRQAGGCQRPRPRIGTASNPSHAVNISYSARTAAPSGTPVSLVATVEVELNKTIATKHTETKEQCREVETENGTKTVCEEVTETWWTSNSTRVTDRVTVTDQVSATVYQLRTALRKAEFPDGRRGVIIQSSDRWNGIRFGSAASITTQWQFFSAGNPDWDRLGTTTRNETSWTESPTVPARVQAFPSRVGVTTDSSRGTDIYEVSTFEGSRHPSPALALPENVSVPVATESYNSTTMLAVRHSNLSQSATAAGVVQGVDGEVVQSDDPVDIREANLTLSVTDLNTSYANVRVTLRDNLTGKPINTSGREGYVQLRESRVETNDSGEAIVTVQNTGLVTARYEPAAWWTSDVGYLPDRARALPRSGIFDADGFGRVANNLLALAVPLLLVLFFLNRVPGAETWPPWRLLR